MIQQFIARKSTLTPFIFLVLLTACAGSDKSANDYQLLEGVYKKTAAIDQQKIADLNKEVLGLQQELGKERGARKAAEARATDVERRLDMQREELARAKDDKTQAGFLGKQLTDELNRAREDRAQLAQSTRQLQQQLTELKQAFAEMNREKERLQAVEAALEKQTKELTTLEGTVRETLPQAKKKANPVKTAKASDSKATETAAHAKSAGTKTQTIVVKQGETLASLAQEHGIAVAQLKELNHLTTDILSPGQKLLVPESANNSSPPPVSAAAKPTK